ncbi:MAG TPA: DUF1638 domain-containing protein [Bacillota bacterium]
MHFKLIACEVLTREVCHIVARAPYPVDLEFTPKDAHEDSKQLRRMIKDRIRRAEDAGRAYDAILLGYGLCGNATAGLAAIRTKLVIPRAHDCCTLFLGSKERFKMYFLQNPSLAFSSTGYCERGDSFLRETGSKRVLEFDKRYEEYVKKYGEENARYLWETLHPPHLKETDRVIFIDIPETSGPGYGAKCRQKAVAEGREYMELKGDISLLARLIHGDWDPEDFLIVEPGEEITGVYDWDEIIRVRRRSEQKKEEP